MIDFTKNYFDLFGLPVDYVLDVGELGMRYRDLQAVVHPDRYANASDQEQRLALQQATQVNEAYETLRDPLRRAIYMLRLHGVDTNQETATTRDTGFLMQQMELREALAEVRGQADPQARLDELLRDIRGMIQSQIAQLAVQLESATVEQLEAARESVSKMQFLNKLFNEAEAIEADLEELI
jgi:molecular chaperone HscB